MENKIIDLFFLNDKREVIREYENRYILLLHTSEHTSVVTPLCLHFLTFIKI